MQFGLTFESAFFFIAPIVEVGKSDFHKRTLRSWQSSIFVVCDFEAETFIMFLISQSQGSY